VFVLHTPGDPTGLEDAIEFEATILVDRGESVDIDLAVAGGGRAETRERIRDWDSGGFGALLLRSQGTSKDLTHDGDESLMYRERWGEKELKQR
jgi:hypothetical protein